MRDTDLLQSNGDDEVMVRQADGTFQKMKLSELAEPVTARKQPSPLAVQTPLPAVASSPARSAPSVMPPAAVKPLPFAPTVKSMPSVAQPSATFVSVPSSTADFESQAESLVGRFAADVAEDLKSRIKMLLVSYLKGIRQEYAVRERLLQSVENGGLGWDAARADLFLKQMKVLSGSTGKDKANAVPTHEIKKEIKMSFAKQAVDPMKALSAAQMSPSPVAQNFLPEIEPEMHMSKVSEAPPQPRMQTQPARQMSPQKLVNTPRIVPPKPLDPRPVTPPQLQQKSQTKISPSPKLEQKKQESSFVPSTPPLNLPSSTSDGIRAGAPPVLKIIEEKGEKSRVVPHEGAIAPQKQPPRVAIPQTPNGKADVKDITYKPRLIGPIDELRTLTLVDFRRLSRDARIAADKIHAKVELLGEESFEKKVKGILAWRASEVNQLYNALLNESLTSNKQMKEVIASRASRKEVTLTMDEFHAIMNLNRQLRF